LIQDAAQKGVPLNSASGVQDNVSIAAVLLPKSVSQVVFGTEIADKYAAIELTIANHNQDASMIVQSVYIDLSDWLLSGNSLYITKIREKGSGTGLQEEGPRTKRSETVIEGNEVASVEYRIARDQLKNNRPFTVRNLIVGGAQALGSIGSAFA
jgi:hypothetical protein